MDDHEQAEAFAENAMRAVSTALNRDVRLNGSLEIATVYALLANFHELRHNSTIVRSAIAGSDEHDPAVLAMKALSEQMEEHTSAMHRLATEMEKMTRQRGNGL